MGTPTKSLSNGAIDGNLSRIESTLFTSRILISSLLSSNMAIKMFFRVQKMRWVELLLEDERRQGGKARSPQSTNKLFFGNK